MARTRIVLEPQEALELNKRLRASTVAARFFRDLTASSLNA